MSVITIWAHDRSELLSSPLLSRPLVVHHGLVVITIWSAYGCYISHALALTLLYTYLWCQFIPLESQYSIHPLSWCMYLLTKIYLSPLGLTLWTAPWICGEWIAVWCVKSLGGAGIREDWNCGVDMFVTGTLEELGWLVNLALFLDMLGLVDVLLVDRDFELVGLVVEETGRLDVFSGH